MKLCASIHWYDNLPELPDSWTWGEMYGEYLKMQEIEADNTLANINYAYDEHEYYDAPDFDLCPFDGIFGRF